MEALFMNRFLAKLLTGIFLVCAPVAGLYAAAGCCSHHGGVSGCNTMTNHQSCKDGTTSPTCLCSGGTSAKPSKTTTTSKTTKTTTSSPSTTSSGTTDTTTSTTATTSTSKTSTKGCCAKHGGVASCDKASGYQMCKDGSKSSTCKC